MTAEEILLGKMLSITSVVLLGIQTLTGMVANGFIILVTCRDGFRSRKLSPTDQILTSLALSRLMLQAIVILNVIVGFVSEDAYKLYDIRVILTIMWVFTNTLDLWFAAWLSCLYFSKIAIFSHTIFLQLKRRFSGLVPRLLLATVVLSAFFTFFVVRASLYIYSICKPNMPFLSNRSDSKIQMPSSCEYFTLLSVIPNLIPITIFLSSTTLLITSLWKHIRRVGVQDLSTQVHLTAVKALVSFAILYLSSFVVVSLQSVLSWRPLFSMSLSLFFHNVSALYPSGHAIILILINPKLKKPWFRKLHMFTCCLIEAQS